MIDAISSGIHRIWDAFVNSEPVQRAMYIIGGFVDNIKALFGSISVFGGLWEMIFGVDGSHGEWDIVGDIINVLGKVGEFLWNISLLDEWLEVIRAIGAYVGWMLRQWNQFVRTDEFKTLIKDFEDIWNLVGGVIDEMRPLFNEVGRAIAEAFGGDELSTVKEDGNELLEMLKAFAQFIHEYIIPILKVVVPVLVKEVLTRILILAKVVQKVAEAIKWVVDGIKWVEEHLFAQNENAPENIANKEGGYNQVMTQKYQTDYSKATTLAQNYVNNTSQPTIINNNFSEGSVQPDARNMTKKEVTQLFTSAFGYNKARGVKGIIR